MAQQLNYPLMGQELQLGGHVALVPNAPPQLQQVLDAVEGLRQDLRDLKQDVRNELRQVNRRLARMENRSLAGPDQLAEVPPLVAPANGQIQQGPFPITVNEVWALDGQDLTAALAVYSLPTTGTPAVKRRRLALELGIPMPVQNT